MPQTSLLSFFAAKGAPENLALPAIEHGQKKTTHQPSGLSHALEDRNAFQFSSERTSDTTIPSDLSSGDSPAVDAVIVAKQPTTPPSSPPLLASKPEPSDNLTYISAFYTPRETSPTPSGCTPASSQFIPTRATPSLQDSTERHADITQGTDQASNQQILPRQFPPQKLLRSPERLIHSSTSGAPEDAPKTVPNPVHRPISNTISTPLDSSLPPLPSIYTISPISSTHLPTLRALTTSLLPLKYSNDFYSSSLQAPDNAISFTVLHNHTHSPSTSRAAPETRTDPKPIGWLRARLDLDLDPQPLLPHRPHAPIISKPRAALYISVLALSASHRHQGLATALLNTLIASVSSVSAPTTSPSMSASSTLSPYHIPFIYAHVWEANTAALEWYEKRGFRPVGHTPVEGYYRKLKPGGAWVVRLDLES